MDPININGTSIETVEHFKLLGIWISNNLTWDYHCDKMLSKMNQRLFLLRQLKRSGIKDSELVIYFKAIIRSVADYACQVFHSGLTEAQTEDLAPKNHS